MSGPAPKVGARGAPSRPRQARAPSRGLATLSIVILLAAGVALAVLFAHQGQVFEQRSAANDYRAARAFELAEAGLEWATARLNDPRLVDARCDADPDGSDLRSLALRGSPATGFDPDVALRWGCRVDGLDWACRCGTDGSPPDLGDRGASAFVVQFGPEPDDTGAVRVQAIGCTDVAPPCAGAAGDPPADAQATAQATLKALPLLQRVPAAALTAGGAVQLAAGRIAAGTGAAAGRLVDAGRTIEPGAVTLVARPGEPVGDGLLPDDPSLAAWLAEPAESSLRHLVGRTPASLAHAPLLRTLGADTAEARGVELVAAVAAGQTAFLAEAPVRLPGGDVGSTDRPVLLVTREPLVCVAPPCRWHGLVIGTMATRSVGDLEGLVVQGAVVSAGEHRLDVAHDLAFDGALLQTLRWRTAALLRVPGSWRDR